MTLDELRNVDFKDLPNLPVKVQMISLALMLLLILLAAQFLIFSGQQDELSALEQQEVQLKEQFLDKKRQATNLAALEAQLTQIESSFGTLLKQLPSRSEMDALLTEINQAGIGRGLQFELFRPGSETTNEQMATLPIQIRLSGSYEELSTFVHDVSRLSRIVTIHDISLTPAGKLGEDKLVMMATARTYRSLDANEQTAKTGAQ